MDPSPPDDSIRRIMSGAAWNEFCDALKAAGNVITSDISPSDAFQRAEGYRYLTRLLRAALETFVEDADAAAPELIRTCHETIKMGADNPDNYYQNAPINGKYAYRLFGRRGTVHYLGFGTQEGNYGATGNLATSGYLDASELALAPDGTFEIAVSCEKTPGNWLPMTPKSRTLVVRQTFLDRAREKPAELKIERVGGRHVPRPLTPQAIDRGLAASAKFVEGCARLFNQWADGFKSRINELPLFDPRVATAAGGVPHIAYYHGYWRLEPDEALVIEVTPPVCDYWNFQLNNHWMESLDYRYYNISINRHSAKLRADGSVRVIVAERDPGAGNWIDTAGHTEGTMCWRWVRALQHPQPATRVVKLGDL